MSQQELADEQIYKRGYNAGFEAGALHAKQQTDRIAELEKSLTQYRIENFIEGEYGQTITLAELRKTELYHNVRKQLTKLTHPVKQLSDEEINKIYLEKYDGHMGFLSPDEVRDFARAIIKEITE